jgi:uncharacterized membrane protein YphA (DoxX/SURF4 family)
MIDAVMKNAVVPLILRLGLAVIFVFHGLQLITQENEWGTAWMTRAVEKKQAEAEKSGSQQEQPAQAPPHALVQLAVAWGQLIGGIALGLGFLTRLAALGIAAIMVGAIALVHWPRFDVREGGFEYNFLIIAVCLVLILVGGGNLAVDRFFRLRRKKS